MKTKNPAATMIGSGSGCYELYAFRFSSLQNQKLCQWSRLDIGRYWMMRIPTNIVDEGRPMHMRRCHSV